MKEQDDLNLLFAEFMGFIHHEVADIDFSECGGIYSRTHVYSKVPILMEKYPESNQFYLHEDWKVTYEDYIYGPLKYDTNWGWIMPVWLKFRDLNLPSRHFLEYVDSVGHGLSVVSTPREFCERLALAVKWYNEEYLNKSMTKDQHLSSEGKTI